jgi:hypothetical protein
MGVSVPVNPPRHKGIYLLPNLFTTGAMFAGFYAIIAGIDGRFTEAVVAVLAAASGVSPRQSWPCWPLPCWMAWMGAWRG